MPNNFNTPPSNPPSVDPPPINPENITPPPPPPPHSNQNSTQKINITKTPPANKFAEIEKLKNTIETGQTANNQPQPNNTTTNPTPNNQSGNFLNNILSNSKLIIGVIIGIIILAAGGYAYYHFVYNQGTLDLTLTTTADELIINGQNYSPQDNQQITFKPGTYAINATKELYYPASMNFEITAGQTTALTIDLKPYPSPVELVGFTTNFPNLDPSGKEIAYLSNFGTTFYKINLNTYEKDVVSGNVFNHITDIKWAPSSRQANILKSINDPKIHQYQTENLLYNPDLEQGTVMFHLFDFSKYNLISQNLIAYPQTILNPTWHPTKEEIVFQYLDPETNENTLSKSKPNMENKEVMFDLPSEFTNALPKYSPDGNLIAIVEIDKTITSEPNPIYLFHVIPRNFEKIPTKEIYHDFIWSPDSTKLVAIKNDNTPTIFDVKTFAATDITLKTDIDRIAWFNDSTRLIVFPIDPDEKNKMLIYDLATEQTSPIPMTDNLDVKTITNPIISRNDDIVYFIGNEFLYSLSIQ